MMMVMVMMMRRRMTAVHVCPFEKMRAAGRCANNIARGNSRTDDDAPLQCRRRTRKKAATDSSSCDNGTRTKTDDLLEWPDGEDGPRRQSHHRQAGCIQFNHPFVDYIPATRWRAITSTNDVTTQTTLLLY